MIKYRAQPQVGECTGSLRSHPSRTAIEIGGLVPRDARQFRRAY